MKRILLLIFSFINSIGFVHAQTWSGLGAGSTYPVSAMAVYNGELYVAANPGFIGVSVNQIRKWNGSSWSNVGTGMTGMSGAGPVDPEVNALVVYNGALYAGGDFAAVDGIADTSVAKWNGTSWSASSSFHLCGDVLCMAIYNNELFAGGGLCGTIGNLKKWNGSAWTVVSGTGSVTYALCAFNGELYEGDITGIHKWNGAMWSVAGGGGPGGGVYALTVYNGELYASGDFTSSHNTGGTITTNRIAKWNGSTWSAVGNGITGSFPERINAIAGYNGLLYVGGDFNTGSGAQANYIAKWNGIDWTPAGTGTNNTVNALTVYNNDLIVGGQFSSAGGIAVSYIAKWNAPWNISSSALHFDGVDDVVTTQLAPSYNIGRSDFTIEAWIRDEASQGPFNFEEIFSIDPASGQTCCGIGLLIDNNGNPAFTINGPAGYVSQNLKDNQCHHLAVMRQAGNFYMCIDTAFYNLNLYENDSLYFLGPVVIGARILSSGGGTINSFNGLIKEVRFWNVARTQSQIVSNMNVVLAPATPNLFGYWRCNEGSGQVIANSQGGNDGVLGTNNSSENSDPIWQTGCSGCVLPTAAITAAGPVTFCAGGSVMLNANTGTGSGYQWQLNGGTIPGATLSSYTVTAAGSYSCVVTNSCGSTTSNVIAATVNQAPSAAITAAGSTTFCSGGSVLLNANTGTGLTYQWNNNGGIIPGETSSSYTAIAAGSYSCVVINTCGNVSSNAITVAVNSVPAMPGSMHITGGSARVCPGDARIYTIGTIPGAVSYSWIAPTGAVITGGQGTTSIHVTYTAGFTSNGILKVRANNICGSGTYRTLTILRNLPATPGTISGPVSVCHATVTNYSIVPVPSATTYAWIVPAGAVIQGPQHGTNISVLWGTSGGTIRVNASNNCGTSGWRSLPVSMPCRETSNTTVENNFEVSVYPNPSSDHFIIKITSADKSNYLLLVHDVTGRIVERRENISIDESFDFGYELSSGVYFAEVMQGDVRKVLRVIKSE